MNSSEADVQSAGKVGQPSLYYRHSGKVDVSGSILSLLAGVIIAVALGVAYSYAVTYIPEVKLRGLACMAFGLGLGALPTLILRKLKVRSTRAALVLIAVVSALGYYVSWASWEHLLLARSELQIPTLTLAEHPSSVYRLARMVYFEGTWSLESESKSGAVENMKEIPLLVIWIIEAAAIFGLAFASAVYLMTSTAFCEQCKSWCSKPQSLRRTVPVDPAELRQQLEAGNFAYVFQLPPGSEPAYFSYDHQRCPGCGQLMVLSVNSHRVVRDKKGRVKKRSKKILIDKLLVGSDDIAQLTGSTLNNPTTPASD